MTSRRSEGFTLRATIAVPRLLSAKNSASSASAIATMRTIGTAQLSFAISCGNGFYAPDLPSLARKPVGANAGSSGRIWDRR